MVALIRPAVLADAARLGKVHVEIWQACYRGILSGPYLDSLSDVRHAAFWARILDDSDRAEGVFVAESQAEGVVGFADSGPERGGAPGWGEVMALYLLPTWQRRGLGRRLVAACSEHLLHGGHDALAIWALRDNPARRFYEAIKGRAAETRPTRIGGAVLIEQCYRWADITVPLNLDY
ncbi:MAG: GNAT family N-acetyltransferase [Alphaproteobacteria bacterium]|nr:GNAT family N-acetyltransferase [Alphaproteobacteria bacterium]